jgi:hypothetical protein
MESFNRMGQYLYIPQMWYGLEMTSREFTKLKDIMKYKLTDAEQASQDATEVVKPAKAALASHRESIALPKPIKEKVTTTKKATTSERLGFQPDISPELRVKAEEHETQLQKQRVLWVDYIKKVLPDHTNTSDIEALEKTKQAKRLARSGIPNEMRGMVPFFPPSPPSFPHSSRSLLLPHSSFFFPPILTLFFYSFGNTFLDQGKR